VFRNMSRINSAKTASEAFEAAWAVESEKLK
jgi:hypothetical protein